MPKVGNTSLQERGAAPRIGDGTVRSRLYAGKPEYSPLLVVCGSDTAPLYDWDVNGSDNVRDAENQQERLLYQGWIVGFVDGEGCFCCPIFRNRGMTMRWQVQPTFVVVQGASSREVLEDLCHFFGCGKVYVNRRQDNHRENLYRYCVGRLADLREIIIPFFQEFPLRTSKRENFAKFVRVIELMGQGRHLTRPGLIEIAEIAETMNHRKPSEVLRILRDHTPTISPSRGGDEDMVRPLWRRREAGGNARPAH